MKQMRNSNDIRFALERYRAGGANRYVCPQCGRRRCFTRYVDLETGEYVAGECGKCDHASSCGYHYPPREYFRDHPERSARTSSVNGRPLLALSPRSFHVPRSPRSAPLGRSGSRPLAGVRPVAGQGEGQTEFFDIAWPERSTRRTSTFRRWLERLAHEGRAAQDAVPPLPLPLPLGGVRPEPLDGDSLRRVLADYYVGGTRRDVVIGGANYGPAVVFWLIDELGRVHDAKLMAYRCDGHRVGGWGNSMRAICERSHTGPQLAATDKVLFGLHLLPRHPGRPVCVVESEKTAIVCACRYPQFVWLATGGCGNLQADRLRPLRGREVVVWPDSGEYGRWSERMAGSGLANYRVAGLMERYEPNTDIADILLGEARLRPEARSQPSPAEACPF